MKQPNGSLDARSTRNLAEARHKPGPWLEGRSLLQLGDSVPAPESRAGARAPLAQEQAASGRWARLVFWSVASEDAGSYSCRVDFRRSRSRTQEWQLNVIGEFVCFVRS